MNIFPFQNLSQKPFSIYHAREVKFRSFFIKYESFSEVHHVHFNVFIIFLGQKLRKLQKADFEQIWDFFPFFQFLTVLSTVLLACFLIY